MRSVTSTACCIILSRSSQAFTRCLLSANVSGLPAPNFLQPLEGLTLALFRCWFAPRFLLPACLPNCSSAALLCHSSLFFRISFKVFQGLSNIRTAVRWNSARLAALSLIFVSSSAMAAFVPALSSTRLCLCRVFLCKLFFFTLKPATRLFSGCESLGLPGVPRRAARSSIACCSSSGVKTTSCCPLALASCNLLLARLSYRTRCRTVGGGGAAGFCILKKAPRVFCLILCCFSSCCTSRK